MAELQFPNFLAAQAAGYQMGNQMAEQNRALQDRNQLRQLAPQIIAGDQNAYAQAAAIDPQAAGQYDAAGTGQLKKFQGLINYMDQARASGNPNAVKAALREAGPLITRLTGKPAPTDWSPEMDAGWEQLKAKVAMAASGGPQGRVQSTYIDAGGNRVAIMADGTTQVLGQNAPNNQIIDTGNGFYGVNKGNLQAAPVVVGGAPQAAPPETTPQPAPVQAFMAADGTPVQIDPSLPPNVQAAARQEAMTGQPMPAQIPGLVEAPPGQQLRSAPKPSEAIQMAQFAAKQTRTLSPDEVAAKGYRPGTIVQVDGYGNETVRQSPSQDRQAMSEAQRKDILARRAKLPQLQNAIRGMGRIEEALQGLEGALVDTGPVDAMVQRYTPAGQELEAAVGGIQNSILALTRVPGIGAQSDLEARIAALQYPSLDKPPEVNRRTLAQLKQFMGDLQAAYQAALEQDNAAQPTGTLSAPAEAPATGGWAIKALD